MPADSHPVSRSRPSPFGDGLTRHRIGVQDWHVGPALAGDLLGPYGLRLNGWLASGAATVVKHGPHRTVYRLTLSSGTFYLKHYKIAGPRAWLQNNLRPCRAFREAAASLSVRRSGIATAEPVAVGRVRTGPFTRDSYFITREIPNAAALDELLVAGERSGKSEGSDPRARAFRGAVTARLAILTATLHRSGLFHADYHAGNVLVRRDGDHPTLWLIDLHPLRTAVITRSRRRAMLGMLAASVAPHATRSDRRRFLAAYSAATAAAENVRAVETACAAEVRRRQARADRKWRRGNRRVLILDAPGVKCRGLAELGRDSLIRWRDDLASPMSGGMPPTVGMTTTRRVTGRGAARAAWETGHALLRRGFPTPRPLLFVSNRQGGAVVTEPVPGCMSFQNRVTDGPADLPASLGRLARKLHDAGFDAPPESFSVTAIGSPLLTAPESVRRRRMWATRRRSGLVRILALLPPQAREAALAGYGGTEDFKRSVRRRLEFASRPIRPAMPPARRVAVLLLALSTLVAGCRSFDKPAQVVSLPAKHSVRADHLVLVSDFKLPKDDPIVNDLVALREHVTETLRLPEPRQDVTVYLFANEEAYRKYLDTVHPGLPPRRAYFVGTSKELAVYTYWGDRVLEDLRHEYTHGILHASLGTVPLWLDEGLAEYFEVPGATPGAMNGDYPHQLALAVSRGWRPDIDRLEALEEFSQMRRLDYQESWAWVHYLLHASPDTRHELLAYLGDLRNAEHPPALADRLSAVEPSYPSRFLGYVANLNATGGAVIRAASAEL